MAGLLSGALMGAPQRLLGAQPAMGGGLLSMFKPELAQSPIYQAFDQRRDTLAGALLGMVGQDDPRMAMRGAAQGVQQGMAADRVLAGERQKQAEAKQQVNRTIGWLTSKFGLSPEDAMAAASNPGIMNHYLKVAQGGDATEYGLNPQTGVDENGNPVLIQIGKDGKAIRTAMPDGVTLSKTPIKLDAGTHFVLLDPITRQPIGQVAKDLAGAEVQKAMGEAEGKARASAAGDYQSSQNALDLIESIRTDPYLERGVGVSSVFNSVPGTGGYDFQNKVNQAKAGAFLSAIETMRGLGALSNAEGQTATAAVARMDTATSKEAFLAALRDYEKIIRQGMARAASRGGAPAAPDGWQEVAPGVRIRQKGQ